MAALPPGVYFDPSEEECVRDYLRPWIASGCDAARTPMHGAVFPVDVYRHNPVELRGMFPPGHARGVDFTWYFVTPLASVGGRGKRRVVTGGYWKVEQKIKDLDAGELGGGGGGKRRGFGFHLPDGFKTAWLMEELADADYGKGSSSKPVFCRIYVSPRADNDKKRAALGEEGVAVDCDGRPKPAAMEVHGDYFNLLAARLPASCVRVHAAPPPPPPPPPPGVHQIQSAQFAAPPPDFVGPHDYVHPPPPPPVVHGHQQGQGAPPQDFLLQSAGCNYYPPAPPIDVAPSHSQQDEEEEIHHQHVEKKQRLAPMDMDRVQVSDEFQAEQCGDANADTTVLQQELVPTPQEEESPPGTASSSPPPPIEFDACKHQEPKNPSPNGGSTDQSNSTHVSNDGDFGLACDSPFLFDGEMPDFDDMFPLEDFMQSIDFDDAFGIDDIVPPEQ